MAKLTKLEIRFLESECIGPEWIFDASAMWTIADCRRSMRESDKFLAIGFRRCESGHRLMNGRGECVQCRPRSLGHIRRWVTPGFVYIAQSKGYDLIKIGLCADTEERQRTLREQAYAEASDWKMRQRFWSSRPAKLEQAVHTDLWHFAESIEYYRFNKFTQTREIFRCSYRIANRAFQNRISQPDFW